MDQNVQSPPRPIVGLFTDPELLNVDLREHCVRVGWYAYLLSRQMGYGDTDARNVMYGAMIHDIGKVNIPISILNKPSPLTEAEYTIMKMHCDSGADLLSDNGFMDTDVFVQIVQSHHERYDGTGYPNGLVGDDIPIVANIVSLADVFDALSTDRCYKVAWEETRVVDYINDNCGTMFNPVIITAFNAIRHCFISFKRNLAATGTPHDFKMCDHPKLIAKIIVKENIFVPFILPSMDYHDPNYGKKGLY